MTRKRRSLQSYSSTATKGFYTLPKGILTWLKNMVLRHLCQDVETVTITLWLKTFSQFWKPSAFIGISL